MLIGQFKLKGVPALCKTGAGSRTVAEVGAGAGTKAGPGTRAST